MSDRPSSVGVGRWVAATIGAGFGLLTIAAGARTLMGVSQPGYQVFGPLLWFNTLMGFGYLLAAGLTWQDVGWGRVAAGVVAGTNAVVLGIVTVLKATGSGVAPESIKAMGFRTMVWVGLFAALRWSAGRPAER